MTQRASGGRLIVALGTAGLLVLAGSADAQTATQDAKQEAREAGQDVKQGAREAGQEIKQGTKSVGEKAQRTGQRAEQAAQRRTGSGEPLSDAWLTAKTKLALLADQDVSGTSINVDTSNGVVSLKGEVASQSEKAKAMQIARGIEGVKQVKNQLTVRAGGSQAQTGAGSNQSGVAKRDDEEIAREVRQQIQKNWTSGELRMDGDTLKGQQDTSIEVSVDDGVVTLDGKVAKVQDIVKAAEAARRVSGVRSVKTNIESGQQS